MLYANIQYNNSCIMLSEFNGCFFCLEGCSLFCFQETYYTLDCNILQSCMHNTFVNITTFVCICVSVVSLMMWCSQLSSSISHDANPTLSHPNWRIYLSQNDKWKVTKPNYSVLANENLIRGVAEIRNSR